MAVKELLATLADVARRNRLRIPYITGGIPRDIALGLLGEHGEINDIDVTTGSPDIHDLAQLFAQEVGSKVRTMRDGHKQVETDSVSFDFSSNFTYKGTDALLKEAGIKHPSRLMCETFSRDFTINALLMPLDLSRLIDLTGKGLSDIEERVLRCPLDPHLSFKESPIRMIRAFYYAAKYGLTIDDSIKDAIQKSLGYLQQVDRRYASEKVNYILREKPEMLEEMIQIGILQKLPLTKDLSKELIKSKRLLDVI